MLDGVSRALCDERFGGCGLSCLPGLVAALLLSLLGLVAPVPAQAASTYLCTGYTACARRRATRTPATQRVNNRMYWRMYSGHNCTNYAAYRMIKAGLPTERPWSGSGMAYNWGIANAEHHRPDPDCRRHRLVEAQLGWRRLQRSRRVRRAGPLPDGDRDLRGQLGRRLRLAPHRQGERQLAERASSTSSDQVANAPDQHGPPDDRRHPAGRRARSARRSAAGEGGPTAYDFQWMVNGVAVPGATMTGYYPTGARPRRRRSRCG